MRFIFLILFIVFLLQVFSKKGTRRRKYSYIALSAIFLILTIAAFSGGSSDSSSETKKESAATTEVSKTKTTKTTETKESATSSSESTSNVDIDAINQEIAEGLNTDKGFGDGTLDKNGDPTNNGTPNPEFEWALMVDKIVYDGKDVIIDVNDKYKDYNEDDQTKNLGYAQNKAYSVIGSAEHWLDNAPDKYGDGLPTIVKYQDQIIAVSLSKEYNKKFDWKLVNF